MDNMTEFLAHHGIKGQKWGVRRFQNSDGTLTSEGKIRYGSGDSKSGRKTDPEKVKRIVKKTLAVAGAVTVAAAAVYVAKKTHLIKPIDKEKTLSAIKKLSDKDLNAQIDRLKKEKELFALKNPGVNYTADLVKKVADRTLPSLGAGAALYGAKYLVSNKYDKNELASALFNGGPKKK